MSNKFIQWRLEGTNTSGELVLYVINDQYPNGIRYNMCQTPGVRKSDYNIPNGSKGWATAQNALKLGYVYLNK